MSYTHNPASPASCLRPLVFRNVRTSTADVASLLVDVYVDAAKVATFRKPWDTSAANFTFDIDVQIPVSRSSAPYATEQTTVFADLGKIEVVTNSDLYRDYYITSSVEAYNSFGYIEQIEGTVETSSAFKSLSAYRPTYDLSFNAYYDPATSNDIKFLTNATNPQPIALNDNYYLSWLTLGINAGLLTFFAKTGAKSKEVVVQVAANTITDKMVTLGVGLANILGNATALTVLNGTLPTTANAEAYGYYTFSAGTWAGGAFTRKTEERRFDIVPDCNNKLRVYWLGHLAGCEQYTFRGQQIRKQNDTGQIGRTATPWDITATPPAAASARGVVKTNIEGRLTIEVREVVDATTGAWLRTLRSSPEVYLEYNGQYIPATITAGDTDYDRNREANVIMPFVIIAELELPQMI
jgi:hypothetical protein